MKDEKNNNWEILSKLKKLAVKKISKTGIMEGHASAEFVVIPRALKSADR